MRISTASVAAIALLSSHAEPILARDDRVLKSSKAGGRGKGSSSSCGAGKGKGGNLPAKDQMTPEAKCDVFRSYHDSEVYIAQNSDRRVLAADDINSEATARLLFPDIPLLCDAFDPVDLYLCPGGPRIAKICTEPRIDNNVAVKERYCKPLFRDICDDNERDECVRRCVQYVSPAQGDCCGIGEVDCDDYPIGESSSSGKGSKTSKGSSGKGSKGSKGSKS
mmetsp:Transcript_2932/g.8530  ORF Transcript_2932/g.8530 Transcript_2932/m.8530 type:complete len:222 (+) Transcript_2932:238-903(+)